MFTPYGTIQHSWISDLTKLQDWASYFNVVLNILTNSILQAVCIQLLAVCSYVLKMYCIHHKTKNNIFY